MAYRPHFLVLSGLSGCLPNDIQVFIEQRSAVLYAQELFSLSDRKAKKLMGSGILKLSLETDGAQYVQIYQCSCQSPQVHFELPASPDAKELIEELKTEADNG